MSQPGYSKWQLVYEPRRGRVYFRAAGESAHTTFDLSLARDLSCTTGPAVADLRGTIVLATRDFLPYSRAIQRPAVVQGLAGVGVTLDSETLERVVRYPEIGTACVERY